MIESNSLYTNAFSKTIWKNSEKIENLLSNINIIENKVVNYLSSITQTFPQLTDHSINHSKMLWNYTNIIVGKENDKYLNPLESFILHVVFLIHD